MPMKVYLETKATRRKKKPRKSVIGKRLYQVEKQIQLEQHFFPKLIEIPNANH